ncbi:MAG: hypothetical protein WD995_10205 [Gemmatimonadota bacterium]
MAWDVCWTWFLLVAMAGCGSVPDVERDPVPLTQTLELRYPVERHDIGYSAQVSYTFRNGTDAAIRLADCVDDVRPLLQLRRDGRWVDAWHPRLTPCDGPPLVVEPGASFGDTLNVVGGPPGSNITPAFIFEEIEGVYRLYWFQAALASDSAVEEAESDIDTDWRVSNPFVLAFH